MIPALDRGLAYGDGLFETIALVEGEPLLWSLHMERLSAGCSALKIPFPGRDLLHADIQMLADKEKCVVKIIVTRGVGGRGYACASDIVSNRIVIQSKWPVYSDSFDISGIKARICDIRLSEQPKLAGLKHLNRLEQVLARAEWEDPEIAEGLMLDANENLIEGIMSNLFVVMRGALYTPDLNNCGVRGVQRQHVINLATHIGIPVHETELHVSQLKDFSEMFLTNSLIGIWPVITVESNQYEVGPVTQTIQKSLVHPA